MIFKRRISLFTAALLILSLLLVGNSIILAGNVLSTYSSNDSHIKWAEFKVTCSAMERALKYDTDSKDSEEHLDWIELLAYLGAKYGGEFKKYKSKDMDALVKRIQGGESLEEITANMKYFSYYHEIYTAVLGGMVGSYQIQTSESYENSEVEMQEKYGLKAYSPIAYGYSFSHYDDFGNSRSFGFKRQHLGNDLMGSIGTPIIAVESGVVEVVGWNRYGGWRVGMRSFDGKRYYYYAHLRKDRPFHPNAKAGAVIEAGDIIGYLGMTGYSTKENVNGMKVPHLHFGMQLIFDESQKDSNNEIWIDVYQIVKFLEHHKSPVVRDNETKEYYRKYEFIDPEVEELGGEIPYFPIHDGN